MRSCLSKLVWIRKQIKLDRFRTAVNRGHTCSVISLCGTEDAIVLCLLIRKTQLDLNVFVSATKKDLKICCSNQDCEIRKLD